MVSGRARWGAVRLAWADAATSDLRFGRAAQRFGVSQQRRVSALRGAAAERFVVGRELLALLLDELAAAAPDARLPSSDRVQLTATCDRCGGAHGAVRVHGLSAVVSVSYAGSMVAVAAASRNDAAAIGIDIEAEPKDGSAAALLSLTAVFDPAPAPSTQGWTQLEAALKADGRGIAGVDVAQCRIEPSTAGRAVRVPGREVPVSVETVPGPAGFVLSVAAIAPQAGSSSC